MSKIIMYSLPFKFLIWDTFSRYCTNCLTEDLTSSVYALVQKIAQFQDRTFNQNPIKATAKRRYVAGISQTNKYLRVKKVKLLVIAPDLEKNCKEGKVSSLLGYRRTRQYFAYPCITLDTKRCFVWLLWWPS